MGDGPDPQPIAANGHAGKLPPPLVPLPRMGIENHRRRLPHLNQQADVADDGTMRAEGIHKNGRADVLNRGWIYWEDAKHCTEYAFHLVARVRSVCEAI